MATIGIRSRGVSVRLAAESAGVKLLWVSGSRVAHVFNPVTMSPIGVVVCGLGGHRFDLVASDPCLVNLGLQFCHALGVRCSLAVSRI
jgi:hypothetical protein